MKDREIEHRIAAMRRFNRFYTGVIGLLQDGYLESPFSLTQVRQYVQPPLPSETMNRYSPPARTWPSFP